MTGGLRAGLVARDDPPEPRYARVERPEPEVVEPAPRPRRVPKWIRRLFGL
jgi:penicillin-binding protein 1A